VIPHRPLQPYVPADPDVPRDLTACGADAGAGCDPDLDAVSAVVRQATARLRACFERCVRCPVLMHPLAMSVSFRVLPDGRVAGVQITGAEEAPPDWTACLAGVVRAARFPARDAPQTFRFPLRLAAAP
jgi:hypothetical protein